MAQMTDQDALMIRYLLGNATEEEQTNLEQQFFMDSEKFEQMQALEDELRYEYAQGGLSPQQRKSFESRFVNTEQDRQKVALAKVVLDKVHQARKEVAVIAAPQESAGWRQSLGALFTLQRFWFASAALALVIVSAGSWMILQTVQLREQVGQLQAERKQMEHDAQQKVAAAGRQRDQLSQELEKERARQNEAKPAAAKSPGSFFSFVLVPGLVRDADGPKRLVLPAGATEVQLELDTKSKGSFRSYRAELQNLDGEVLWSRTVPRPLVMIPARLLAPGDYVVILKGIGPGGEAGDAGDFYFTLVKR